MVVERFSKHIHKYVKFTDLVLYKFLQTIKITHRVCWGGFFSSPLCDEECIASLLLAMDQNLYKMMAM